MIFKIISTIKKLNYFEIFFSIIICTAAIYVASSKTTLNYSVKPQTSSTNRMTDLVIQSFDSSGKMQYAVTAKEMQEQDSTIYVNTPDIIVYKGEQHPWHIQAQQAITTTQFSNIELYKQVRILIPDENVLIKTEQISFKPQDNTAATDKYITMQNQQITMSSIGLQADLNSGTFRLLTQATASYDE